MEGAEGTVVHYKVVHHGILFRGTKGTCEVEVGVVTSVVFPLKVGSRGWDLVVCVGRRWSLVCDQVFQVRGSLNGTEVIILDRECVESGRGVISGCKYIVVGLTE